MTDNQLTLNNHKTTLPNPKTALVKRAQQLAEALTKLPLDEHVSTLNAIRHELHKTSPFNEEPVDLITWAPAGQIHANDYNPNTVAPPEMELLEHSIKEDGFTQPIVTWQTPQDTFEVVDGFHRNRIGKESHYVNDRLQGYLPLTIANADRLDRGDRISATIRHNRARGKHRIDSMAEIVLELKRRNWTDKKIGKELGMDPDEVLRLAQITGLAEIFADREFSQAWEADLLTDHDIDTESLD